MSTRLCSLVEHGAITLPNLHWLSTIQLLTQLQYTFPLPLISSKSIIMDFDAVWQKPVLMLSLVNACNKAV